MMKATRTACSLALMRGRSNPTRRVKRTNVAPAQRCLMAIREWPKNTGRFWRTILKSGRHDIFIGPHVSLFFEPVYGRQNSAPDGADEFMLQRIYKYFVATRLKTS